MLLPNPRKRKKLLSAMGSGTGFLAGLVLFVVVSRTAVTTPLNSGSERQREDSENENKVVGASSSFASESDFDARTKRLYSVCNKYTDPFRPESLTLSQPAASLGSEVVYLDSEGQKRPGAVCIPHKVGSNSWGKFSRLLGGGGADSELSWEKRALLSERAVVVRHPMARLVSVYRMIFEDWCDPDRFLAKQWGNVCQYEAEKEESATELATEGLSALSASAGGGQLLSVTRVLGALLDEHQHGNDRFMRAAWSLYHPGEALTDPRAQMRFTFPQFAHLLVNGTRALPSAARAQARGIRDDGQRF